MNSTVIYPEVQWGNSQMVTSPTLAKLAPALLKAQRKIGGAKKGAANPFFKSKYADLGSVMEACKDALNEEGIVVLQPAGSDASGNYVETILLHESGEMMSRRLYLVLSKPDMQQLGSAISYGRRYGLQSMVFIPSEDDDGEGTMSRTPTKSSYPTSKPVAQVQSVDTATTAVADTVTVTATPPKTTSTFRKTPAKPVATTTDTTGGTESWE